MNDFQNSLYFKCNTVLDGAQSTIHLTKHTVFSYLFFCLSYLVYTHFFSSIKCQIEVLVLLIKKRVSLIYYHLDNRLLLYLGFVSHQNCHIYCNYSK